MSYSWCYKCGSYYYPGMSCKCAPSCTSSSSCGPIYIVNQLPDKKNHDKECPQDKCCSGGHDKQPCCAERVNLIRNGGFEDRRRFWNFQGFSFVGEYDYILPHSGDKAAVLVAFPGFSGAISQEVDGVCPGKVYRLDVNLASFGDCGESSSAEATILAEYLNEDGQSIGIAGIREVREFTQPSMFKGYNTHNIILGTAPECARGIRVTIRTRPFSTDLGYDVLDLIVDDVNVVLEN